MIKFLFTNKYIIALAIVLYAGWGLAIHLLKHFGALLWSVLIHPFSWLMPSFGGVLLRLMLATATAYLLYKAIGKAKIDSEGERLRKRGKGIFDDLSKRAPSKTPNTPKA